MLLGSTQANIIQACVCACVCACLRALRAHHVQRICQQQNKATKQHTRREATAHASDRPKYFVCHPCLILKHGAHRHLHRDLVPGAAYHAAGGRVGGVQVNQDPKSGGCRPASAVLAAMLSTHAVNECCQPVLSAALEGVRVDSDLKARRCPTASVVRLGRRRAHMSKKHACAHECKPTSKQMSAHMSAHLPAHLSKHMSKHLSPHLSRHMSTHLFTHLSKHMPGLACLNTCSIPRKGSSHDDEWGFYVNNGRHPCCQPLCQPLCQP